MAHIAPSLTSGMHSLPLVSDRPLRLTSDQGCEFRCTVEGFYHTLSCLDPQVMFAVMSVSFPVESSRWLTNRVRPVSA